MAKTAKHEIRVLGNDKADVEGPWKPIGVITSAIDKIVDQGDSGVVVKTGDYWMILVTKDGRLHHERAEAMRQVAVEVSPRDLDKLPLHAAMKPRIEPDIFDEFWGPAPSSVQEILDETRERIETTRIRAHVLNHSLSRAEAAELLGCSSQTISEYIDSGTLLALKKGREWRLPEWQFDLDSQLGYIEGLKDLHEAFPGGIVTLTIWVERSTPELDDLSPLQALRAGRRDEVLLLARSLTAAAW